MKLSYSEAMAMMRESFRRGEIRVGGHIDQRVAGLLGLAPTVARMVRDAVPVRRVRDSGPPVSRRPMAKWENRRAAIGPRPRDGSSSLGRTPQN